jgi:hypothetical protein
MGLDLTQLRQDMCTIEPADSQSYSNWGRLVKTWVTGINQFNDNKDYSIPATGETLQPLGSMTKDQFQGMLRDANVTMTVPDRVKRFVFVQDDESTVIVRIPAKKVVEDIQGLLEGLVSGGVQQATYPLPKFYTEKWPLTGPTALPKQELLAMHCQRIGEYTINTCG